jgi:uncharacterized pyridoxamine 5'-phosphate oxidase family protein
MEQDVVKSKIGEILKSNQLCVIATVGNDSNQTESAVIAFAEMDNFSLLFGTSNQSRKYKNIITNNKVSFVIGWDPRVGTVQYEGIAREVDESELDKITEILVLKSIQNKKFVGLPGERYFVVSPKWIRITDRSENSIGIQEIHF